MAPAAIPPHASCSVAARARCGTCSWMASFLFATAGRRRWIRTRCGRRPPSSCSRSSSARASPRSTRRSRRLHRARVERRDRPGEAFEAELADGDGLGIVFDRGLDPLAQEDLARLRFGREPLRQDDDVADRAVVVPALEADAPERGIARRDADAEAELIALFLPGV